MSSWEDVVSLRMTAALAVTPALVELKVLLAGVGLEVEAGFGAVAAAADIEPCVIVEITLLLCMAPAA